MAWQVEGSDDTEQRGRNAGHEGPAVAGEIPKQAARQRHQDGRNMGHRHPHAERKEGQPTSASNP